MRPVSILASGMVTCVGLDAPSSCAAIRCAIDNFSETRFMDKGGEWIIGAQVPLEQPWRGLPKLVHMAVLAIKECLAHARNATPEQIPLLLCIAEKERPGRLGGLDDELLQGIQAALGTRFHARYAVIPRGRVAGALAMELASRLIHEERVPYCIIAGVDSFLVAETLAAYEEKNRLLTSQNSNGFIPGEGGAAILVGPAAESGDEFRCLGIGTGAESATIDSEQPLRADGLVQAIKAALSEAGCTMGAIDFRISDLSGEQYFFKEASLALDRSLKEYKHENPGLWHPADCIGEIGAAVGPISFGVSLRACLRGYAPGSRILCHFSSDRGERAAMVLLLRPNGVG